MVRSDMIHITMCIDSGVSEMKSQKVSWAVAALGEGAVGLHFDGVNEVGKFYRVLNEEHRDVVADKVPVAFLRVELDGKSPHVARRVDRARPAGDGRKPGKHRRLFPDLGQDFGGGVRCERLGQFEISVHSGAARMHDALRNALVIEVGDLFAKHEILEQRRPPRMGPQRVLVVGNRDALVRRQHRVAATGVLVHFSSAP